MVVLVETAGHEGCDLLPAFAAAGARFVHAALVAGALCLESVMIRHDAGTRLGRDAVAARLACHVACFGRAKLQRRVDAPVGVAVFMAGLDLACRVTAGRPGVRNRMTGESIHTAHVRRAFRAAKAVSLSLPALPLILDRIILLENVVLVVGKIGRRDVGQVVVHWAECRVAV